MTGNRVAVPIAGPGGKIAIFDTNKPGRIPDGVQPALINGSTVLDFAFDPFDNNRKWLKATWPCEMKYQK